MKCGYFLRTDIALEATLPTIGKARCFTFEEDLGELFT